MKINEKNLCVFAKTPPFDMEGFLNKRGENIRTFQKRYFVLKGNLLFYFESRLDKEPLGLIIVEGCIIELSTETDVDNFCFEIGFNGNRTYVLAADSQVSMEAWMKALTCAGYEYKRIIVAELQRQLKEIEESRNKMRVDQQAQDVSNALDKPEPPPRRQNPFNRRAPPPPPPPSSTPLATKAVGAAAVPVPMPFINGYFGSSSARAQQELLYLDNGNNTINNNNNNNNNSYSSPSPHSTPRALRRQATGASPSVFYNDLPVATSRATVLTSRRNSSGSNNSSSNNNNDELERSRQERHLAKISEKFRRKHESYRANVMADIIAYRQRRAQPLIQF